MCVEAINLFRQSHGLLPLVITSRTADYEALTEPLRLQGGVLVQRLTREQVTTYLADLGDAGKPIEKAICEDSSLWELLDSPLMLNVLTVAYAGQSEMTYKALGTFSERRDHLFESYVRRVLHRATMGMHYTQEQTVLWLRWLAYCMAEHGHAVFYLERLQRDWLPVRKRWAVQLSSLLASGLAVAFVVALAFATFGGGINLTYIALDPRPFGHLGELVDTIIDQLSFGILRGLLVGLIVGSIIGLVGGLFSLSRGIECAETVRWSWSNCRRSARLIVYIGLLVGPAMALFMCATSVEEFPVFGLGEGVLAALFFGLIAGLIAMLLRGLTTGEIDTRAIPNQGIHGSARNALFMALAVSLIGGFVVTLAVALVIEGFARFLGQGSDLSEFLSTVLEFGLVVGLLGGPIAALIAGGDACIKHFVLRTLAHLQPLHTLELRQIPRLRRRPHPPPQSRRRLHVHPSDAVGVFRGAVC